MVTLRRADAGDWAALYYWRTDPETVRYSLESPPSTVSGHVAWLHNTLHDQSVSLFVAYGTGRVGLVGTVRLDFLDRVGECSMTVDPRYRGRGYGMQILKALIRNVHTSQLPLDRLRAQIKITNKASLRVFATCGFKLIDERDGYVVLELGL